ncbi:MAG TPA: hypothetical protein VMM38_06050 [Aridibacter sp.]|nr:hypothetical protein [Aridibacter sp.]
METRQSSSETEGSSLARSLASEIERGARVVSAIGAEAYRQESTKAGSIGVHIRHNLDLIDCFLRGIGKGEVDYTARQRDTDIESDAAAAAARTRALAEQLAAVEGRESEPVRVGSEIDHDILHESTVGRELEFLHCHTVHHHALIAERLRAMRIETESNFGVAPSTLRFWRNEAAAGGR